MPGTMRRDLVVVIDAETGKVVSGLDKASKASRAYEREMRRLERQQARVDAAMERVGRGMLVAGAAIAAGLAMAVKAAIDWESSWAGVLKTVDGTDEQMAALEEQIRGLTEVLPASHAEIAAVAEAAGQLGVQRQNVAGFTRVMIDMGEATNLAATDAATALARMMNIMQTAPGDVSRLGSTIVDLGNKSATTEAEIVEMALRISGAGKTIGMTEAQVVGFAAALSSVGIRAEAGGTAISRVFLKIDASVRAGGESLDTFAETAGMSAEQFQQAYQTDAAGAIDAFVRGLGKIQAEGGDVNAVLDQLGLSEIRVSDALRRLSGSGDLLTRSLRTGTAAWEENTALVEEAERRYGTVEARLGIARNQVNDFAITVGQTFLPMVGKAADTTAQLAAVIGDLPAPIRVALGVLAAATAVLLLAGGTALIAVPKLHAFRQALDQIAASGTRAAAGVGMMRRVVGAVPWGPLGLAISAATVAITAYGISQANARAKVEDLSQTLDEQTGAVTENTRLWIANQLANREATGVFTLSGRQLNDFTDNLDEANVSMRTAVDAVTGDAEALAALNEQLAEAKQREDDLSGGIALSTTERGRARAEAKSHRRAIEEIIEVVESEAGGLEKATELRRLLAEGTGEVVEATEELAPATRDLADAFGVSGEAAEDVAGAVDDLDKELEQLFDRVFGLSNAQDDLADAFDALTEKVREQKEAGVEGAGSLKGMSEAARENRDLAQELLQKYGAMTLETIKMTGSQEEAEAVAKNFKKRLEELAEQTGVNVEDLEGYNDVVAEIERLIEVAFETPGMTEAERNARNLKVALDKIPRQVDIDIHQSILAPVGAGRVGHQHGGEIQGPAGPDRVPIMATAGEIMIRQPVAQMHREQLLALNRTGRWPVGAGGGQAAQQVPGGGGGMFTGELFLDSGAFLGTVRGEIRQSQADHDRRMRRQIDQGVGAAA